MSTRGAADAGAADASTLSAASVPGRQRAPGGERVVERAGAADLAAIDPVLRSSLQSPWSPKALRDEFVRADSHFWVVRHTEQVVGFIATRVVAGELHIMNVAVAKLHRRVGIGTSLLRAALLEARDRGLRAALLELRASNDAALALYAAHGFLVVGRRPRYYPGGEDAVLMTLELEPSD